jgi:hypothetical protein
MVHFNNILLRTTNIPSVIQKKSSRFDRHAQFINPSKNFISENAFPNKAPRFPKDNCFFKVDWLGTFVSQAREACEQKGLRSICRMIMAGGKQNYSSWTCPSANTSITNLTRKRPRSHPGFRGDKTASNTSAMAEKVTRIVLFKY